MSPAAECRSLDPSIWKACAGTAGKIPAVGSLVYYFPQGHAEQSSSPPDFSSISVTKPYALCRVSAIKLLANPDTDEVFAKIGLDPKISSPPSPEITFSPDEINSDVVSFAKILTPSDANNGGGFSVPRFCADSIFPELDFKADPPVQNIKVKDVHGDNCEFRHIYRGTPRRHLLTTGWSRFVNDKKLVAGDSVIFIKNRAGELFIGIRRTGRSCGGNATEYLPAGVKLEENSGSKNGFSRNVKGRVPAESVVEAVRLMEMDQPFDVLYYPRAGLPEFVVGKEVVEAAMGVYWSGGMRIKMSVETEDSSRMTWFQGMVSCAAVKDSGPWPPSPWRMLQVTWDEPEVLQNVRTVSPWQVELVSASPQIQAPYPALKRLRVPHRLELSSEGQGNMLFPTTVFNSTKMGSLTSSLFNYNIFPAGMQGARHDICVSSLSNFAPRNTHMFSDNPYGINMPQELNTSRSEGTSPLSLESIHHHRLELLGAAACNPTKKASKGSFQLFGQIIHMDQPSDDVDKEYVENNGEVRSLDFSLSYPHKQLLDGLDVQRQRISAVEACFL